MLYKYNEERNRSLNLVLVADNDDNTEYIGELIDARIDPDTIPKGKFWYHCRHSDNGDWCTPVTIEPNVFSNFCGTFITDREITFPNPEDEYIPIKDIRYLDN